MRKLFNTRDREDWNSSLTITAKGKKLYIRFDDSRSSYQHLYTLILKYDDEEKGFVLIEKKGDEE